MGLMRRLVLGDLDLTDYPFGVEFGGDFGSPQNVYDTLVSMLADGDIVGSTRVTNREITFTVQVEGATLADLAANEALLIAESDKARNELMLDPGDDYAPAIVFETFRVQVTPVFDDDLEQANYRRYELTIPARPYTRESEPVVTLATALGGGGSTPTYTLVDSGSSLTNWGLVPSDEGVYLIATVSGKIRVTRDPAVGTAGTIAASPTRTATVNVAAARYVVFDVSSANVSMIWGSTNCTTSAGACALALINDLGGGVTRLFYALPSGVTSVSYIRLRPYGTGVGSGAASFDIDQVQLADILPSTGTTRQKAMSVVPGGSVRTSGSIEVAHATDALGKTIVYTHPAGTGYLPPLRPWRVSGDAVTTDSTLVSGARNGLVTPNDFNIPVPNLPSGRVELWARLRANSTTAFPLIWTVESWMNGTSLNPDDQTVTLSLPASSAWLLVHIGVATMPPVAIGPSGYVRVKLQRDPGSSVVVDIDEAYLFATDEGRLTIVDCGTGTAAAAGPSNRLWIDAPSLEQPTGGIYRGNAADRSNQWHAGKQAEVWQTHEFSPDGTSVFVATFNAGDAQTSLQHHRRYHTHVAL